jgi:hypothetical protein
MSPRLPHIPVTMTKKKYLSLPSPMPSSSSSSSSSSPSCHRRLSSLTSAVSKIIVFSVVLAAAVLTIVSVHNLYPVLDPVTPVGVLDHLSLFLGVHQQTAVVVVDVGLFGSTVYTYVFHRHVADGSFHVASETKKNVLPGLFDGPGHGGGGGDAVLQEKAAELLRIAMEQVPPRCFHAAADSKGRNVGNPPLLAKIDPAALKAAKREHADLVVSVLTQTFADSPFAFNPNGGGIGTLSVREERVLQWFAVNLLTHTLRSFSVGQTAVIVNVGPTDVELTLAVSSTQKVHDEARVKHVNKLSAFGHSIKLLTLVYPGLGLYPARFYMLTKNGIESNGTAKSECVNPITESRWRWEGRELWIRGKEKPDYELVKERNGPFAGKKVNRPVANYDQCHNLAKEYLEKNLGRNASESLRCVQRPV